jgi:hypothetical protein
MQGNRKARDGESRAFIFRMSDWHRFDAAGASRELHCVHRMAL